LPLTTKAQYINYEPGEFSHPEQNTYQQTIDRIEAFPWTSQREHLRVGLTCPSITIEDGNGHYCKLACYYEGKFILYYLNPDNEVYSKSFPSYQDAYPYVKAFFDDPSLDTTGFKHEQHWLEARRSHFASKDFRYTPRLLRFLAALLFLFLWILLLLIQLRYLLLPSDHGPANMTGLLIFSLPTATLASFFLAAFLSHYRYSKDLVLIISRGQDTFYYGHKDHPQKFNKKDISEIVTYGTRNSKGGDSFVVRYEIIFKDGTYIYISSLLIPEPLLCDDKLAGYPYRKKYKLFPFIPRGASAPS